MRALLKFSKHSDDNSIVFIRGNANRAAGEGFSKKRKQFEKRILKLLGKGTIAVSSNDYKEVPSAKLYVGWSRGCSRMNRFGDKSSKKICLDEYQDGGKANDAGHYIVTNTMKRALLKFSKHTVDWKDVTDFPAYEISSTDGIRKKSSQKGLKGRNWIGYPKVTLMRDGKKHEKRIHKLVAEHFVPNPKKLAIVNHDDSNRSNYKAENLSWMSQSDNMKHRWETTRAGVKKEQYGHEHGKNKMDTEDYHDPKKLKKTASYYQYSNIGKRMKALDKFANNISKETLIGNGGVASKSPGEYSQMAQADKDIYNQKNMKALQKFSKVLESEDVIENAKPVGNGLQHSAATTIKKVQNAESIKAMDNLTKTSLVDMKTLNDPSKYRKLVGAEKNAYLAGQGKPMQNAGGLTKMSQSNSRGRNSLFARINRAKKMGIKFKKKSAVEYMKMKKTLQKMKRRSVR